MTQPRRLLPVQTHAFTRRTARRTFLLQPTEAVNEIVLYSLGAALQKNPLFALHAFMSESTHQHVDATDLSKPGQLSQVPAFWEHYSMLAARALNTHYGRGENFWKTGSYDPVEIHDQAALEDQLLYTWTNPVKDGLVATPEEWPGIKFLPRDFGKTFTVKKPKNAFFGGRRPKRQAPTHPTARDEHLARLRREEKEALAAARERDREAGLTKKERKKAARARRLAQKREARRAARDRSSLPDEVTFTIHPPPGYLKEEGGDMETIEEVIEYFEGLLRERVAEIHAQRRAEGKLSFLGVPAVLAQDPLESSGDTFPTFELNPRVACKDKERRIEVLLSLQAWREQYRVKRAAFKKARGKKRDEVVFPLGTYGVQKHFGATVSQEELLLEGGLLRAPPIAA